VAADLSSPPQVIVLGPPGAGKGTQAARLAEHLGLVHISPGRILRDEAETESERGRRIRAIMAAGELVPEDVVDRVVRERLEALSDEEGFVVDGYPRTASEALTLRDSLAQIGRLQHRPLVVWLEVPRDALLRRLRRRRAREGRADDAEDAIARRLETHDAHAHAVREAMDGWADVIVIDGSRPADEVSEEILQGLGRRGWRLPSRQAAPNQEFG
jgi:adenylate kinase